MASGLSPSIESRITRPAVNLVKETRKRRRKKCRLMGT
jgi:hypothetical protein